MSLPSPIVIPKIPRPPAADAPIQTERVRGPHGGRGRTLRSPGTNIVSSGLATQRGKPGRALSSSPIEGELSIEKIEQEQLARAAKETESLRRRYDDLKTQEKRMVKELEQLQSELKQLGFTSAVSNTDAGNTLCSTVKISSDLDVAQVRLEEALRKKKMYEHLQNRLENESLEHNQQMEGLQSSLHESEKEIESQLLQLQMVRQEQANIQNSIKEITAQVI